MLKIFLIIDTLSHLHQPNPLSTLDFSSDHHLSAYSSKIRYPVDLFVFKTSEQSIPQPKTHTPPQKNTEFFVIPFTVNIHRKTQMINGEAVVLIDPDLFLILVTNRKVRDILLAVNPWTW